MRIVKHHAYFPADATFFSKREKISFVFFKKKTYNSSLCAREREEEEKTTIIYSIQIDSKDIDQREIFVMISSANL